MPRKRKHKVGVSTPGNNQYNRAYPFVDMRVGDWFEVPLDMWMRAKSSASAFGRRHGQTYKTSKSESGVIVRRMA